MPTGYTAGIESGEITSFSEYATLCTRAFGATMHMRDESLDAQYVECTPNTYYVEKINALKREIKALEKKSDSAIEKIIITRAKKDIKYAKQSIAERIEIAKKLNEFLAQAEAFVPPTKDHIEFKNFLINQLTMTISTDTSIDYPTKLLKDAESRLKNLKKLIASYKKTELKSLKKDIAYYTSEYKREVAQCKKSNKWVSDVLKAINK